MPRGTTQISSKTVATIASGAWVKVLAGNKRRVGLIITDPGGNFILVSNSDLGVGNGGLFNVGQYTRQPLSVSDYGPLITDEIWVAKVGTVTNVTATELYKAGR